MFLNSGYEVIFTGIEAAFMAQVLKFIGYSLINRKIDSLENKISKTLVDTIIDLQMDEAPLIIKKAPNNIEVCASCNQIIQKEKENKSLTNNNEAMSPNHLNNNNKSLNSLSINKFMNNSTNKIGRAHV